MQEQKIKSEPANMKWKFTIINCKISYENILFLQIYIWVNHY